MWIGVVRVKRIWKQKRLFETENIEHTVHVMRLTRYDGWSVGITEGA